MKAKRIITLMAAMVMVLSFSGAVLAAVPSPTAATVATTSENVKKVEVKAVTPATEEKMVKAAEEYVAEKYGAVTVVETLLTIDLIVERTDDKPVTLLLNVAGVQVGETIYVVHEKADGSIEYIPALVPANGVIEFTIASFSPISIVRVLPEGVEADTPTMPKTGDKTSAVPMAILLIVCTASLMVCRKA